MSPEAIATAAARLFTLLGVDMPSDGRVEFVIRGGKIVQVRPQPYVDVPTKALAPENNSAHTDRR